MKIKEVLTALYSSNIYDVVQILNKSVFIKDAADLKGQVIIHTGITFKIQTGSLIEVFFDIKYDRLIRQIRFENKAVPCLLGLHVKMENKSIPGNTNVVFSGVSECEENFELYNVEGWISVETVNHKHFETYLESPEGIKSNFTQFPLKRHIDRTIYFGNTTFSFAQLDEDLNNAQHRIDEAHERREMDRANFDAMTDGNLGSYDDFEGDASNLGPWSGRD